MDSNTRFGQTITKLIQKNNLGREEAYQAFYMMLANEVSEMQQGAFLAALTAKGETEEEVAGGWKAVYELDTCKVDLACKEELVDNCGTGMDSFKTFNISTAASIVAAAGGVKIARHGARAITSSCGTVDMAELLGVDVECGVETVANSIEKSGIGLFNGMSPAVHPMALGRILSQIRFGSPLNIAASLANPALPKNGVRGVYSKELLMPVARVMRSIGYHNGIVVYGAIDNSDRGMDEASVCGTTHCVQLKNGELHQFSLEVEDSGLQKHPPEGLLPSRDPQQRVSHMVSLLAGRSNGAARDAVLLNSALIFQLRELTPTVAEGVELAADIIDKGKALDQLEKWVECQNRSPSEGKIHFQRLTTEVLQ
ncbi:anthranilate phosphoribosyltransferase [Desulfopila sp. IMCC35008]|uniref:anthranilate phosphoribosyltransferase n=1 Tax=Desulfopila sp. IMCC35008 TaxID=2653858 RepID=UPI00197A873D|nr:anthranilate phosphoribosyltransferase [Desulfopila sp. IMCC35008]